LRIMADQFSLDATEAKPLFSDTQRRCSRLIRFVNHPEDEAPAGSGGQCMSGQWADPAHRASHRSAGGLQPPRGELIRVGSPSRRWFLQTGLGGFAGLSMGRILQLQAEAASPASGPPGPAADRKSVILFWLSGGPSHLDMWDPKPDAPAEVRGP